MMNKLLVILMLMIGMCGCNQIKDACTQAIAVTTQLQSQLADAKQAREVLESSGLRELLPPDKQEIYDKAMRMADEGYDTAVKVLAAVEDVCSIPDLHGPFDIIIRAWDLLMPLFGEVGGTQVRSVTPPVIWGQVRQ